MASRKEQKERLRRDRLEREGVEQVQTRRKRLRGYGVALVLGAAVIAIVALVLAGGGGKGSMPGPFGTHYAGLGARRAKASVPTMMNTMSSASHFHPHIAIYVNGKQVQVPANIGIDPGQPSMAMAGLHTHDTKGTIHDEGMAESRLGQFFNVWGVAFSPTQLGPYRASGTRVLRMWVDGKPSRDFGSLALADGQRIVLAYGDKKAPPPPLK